MERSTCRRKSLEIIKCKQCHYSYRNWEHNPIDLRYKCEWPGLEVVTGVTNNTIPDPNTIPEWCPLEDWPNE